MGRSVLCNDLGEKRNRSPFCAGKVLRVTTSNILQFMFEKERSGVLYLTWMVVS